MRNILVNYQICHNATLILESVLDRSFGAAWSRCEADKGTAVVWPTDAATTINKRPELLAVSSFTWRYPKVQSPDWRVFDMLFLRDPFARIVAAWNFYRSKPMIVDPPCSTVSTQPLGDFVKSLMQTAPQWVNDVQVSHLSQQGQATRPPTARDLQAACNIVEDCSCPGVVDLLDDSLAWAAYYQKLHFPTFQTTFDAKFLTDELQPDASKKSLRDACGAKPFQALSDLVANDVALVDFARKVVAQRVKLIPKA